MIDICVWSVLGALLLAAAAVAVRRRRASAVSDAELDRLLDALDRADAPGPAAARSAQEQCLARILADHPAPGGEPPASGRPARAPGDSRRARGAGAGLAAAKAAGDIAVVGVPAAVACLLLSSGASVQASTAAMCAMITARLVPLAWRWSAQARRAVKELPIWDEITRIGNDRHR
uniref:hypothetical protein n=1 Tax=Amycolatopsis sp. CA-096443 TaxID=3239919 RepID=UPI003F4964CB